MPTLRQNSLYLCTLITGFSPLAAGTLYWDVNGTADGAANSGVATGTWNSSNMNWTTDPDGLLAPGSFVAGSDVVFSAGIDTGTSSISTITIGEADLSVGDVTFEEGKYTFSGNSLLLNTGNFTIGSGSSLTLAGTSLKIAGAVVMTNDSSTSMGWTSGGFSVVAGIAAPSVTLSGGSFTIRASGLSDSSGGGAFSLTIQDGASVTHGYNGTNTYTGGTFIKSGSLRAATAANLGSGAVTLGDASGSASALLNFTNSTVVANNLIVRAGGDSIISNGGAGNTNRYTGNISLGGNLTLTTTASSGSTPYITFDTSSVVSGAGGLAMTRNGSNLNNLYVTLRGNNTYAGGTVVNYGTLRIDNGGTDATNSAIGTGALTVNGGRIDNTSGDDVTLATNNQIVLNADLTFTGSGNLDLGTGAVSLGTAAGTTRTITTDASVLKVGGVVSDGSTAQNIVKAGSGTLILSGDNDYSGTTTVSAGALYVNGVHSGTGAITVASGATLGGSGVLAGATAASSGSILVPGSNGVADTLSFAGSLDISGLADGTGGLRFDLDGTVTSDQITAGSLNIGTGLLEFDDFVFTTLSGFTNGVYTLISTSSISGTLGSNLSGQVGGVDGTLSISGNDIILTVGTIPEPSVISMLAGLASLSLAGLCRRRSRSD